MTTPAAPTEAPAAPTALTATPDGPFRIELKWQNRSQNEYGFEVQKRTPLGDVRVGLANPHDSSFVVHGRPPQSSTTYRVRSFNPRGVSLPSNDATATTSSVTNQGESTEEAVEPCTTRAKVMESILSEDPEGPDRQPRVEKLGGPLIWSWSPIRRCAEMQTAAGKSMGSTADATVGWEMHLASGTNC